MALKSKYRSRWLLRASEVLLLTTACVAQAAHAEVKAASAEATGIIDRSEISSAFALERSSAAPSAGIALILAVEINGMDHGLAQFRLIDDRLWATRTVLRDLGLKIEMTDVYADDLLLLTDELGDRVSYNAAMQSVSLMVETSKLAVATSRLNYNNQDQPIAQSATGALLNYDLYANYNADNLMVDGFTEARFFSGNALLENTALLRFGSNGQTRRRQIVRLDTSVAYSLPEVRLTFRAGDIITRSTSWSRPTRIGGLRIGTDFSLQPYLVTAPIQSFFGEATLPATVDLYINGLRSYSGEVAPGPFEIGSGGNRINGAGDAQLVVTDVLGQVTTLDFPIYDTPQLLREDLTDWSIEVGAVREGHGISSFDYAPDLVATASWRHGVTNIFTVEAHGELGPSLVNSGVGAAWVTPFRGVISGSFAASSYDGEVGYRVEIGYSWTDSDFNLAATLQRASDEYADIALLHDAQVPIVRDIVSMGYNSTKLGSFNASVIRQRYTGEPTRSYASFNWNMSLDERFSISLSANQDLEETSDRGAFMTLTFVPNSRDHASASIRADSRRTSGALGYRHSVPYEGGTGWAIDANFDGDRIQAAGQIDHLGSRGQATVGARMIGNNTSVYAGYSGGLVTMGNGLFASRKIYDGFAVVSTNGIAEIPVRLHNREVGRTDVNGNLLVTGLNAHQNNRVTIDPSDLSATLDVPTVERQAVPSQRAGVIIQFQIAPTRSILVSLVDEMGDEIPLGLSGRMEGSEDQVLMVGFGGQLYIDHAQAGALVTLETDTGPCNFRLPQELPSQNAGRLGQMLCRSL